ncbi:MAG: 3-dehydroquinate synthase [Clostridia bacterium]|jgi:3-dehydroquinate synthase|nr:3-dehydroquinate synthase [Clostridia bacterium]
MQDVILNISQKSVIHCGKGSFEKYTKRFSQEKVFLITDDNVNNLYRALIDKTFKNCVKHVICAGESSKNTQVLLQILQAMLKAGMRRNGTVIALGGGVVGDIAGLAASLYMRGVHIVQIPTTLLAQVDSSVGGKTAVDMEGVKNVIGAFYQPEEVIIDPLFLKTLPEREINCGLGEIIKYGALDAEIYDKLLSAKNLKDLNFLGDITCDCVKFKAEIVSKDERDLNGVRKILNLGHTTGHALELNYGEKSHGEYVLIGAYYELQIARNYGICGGEYAENLEKLILSVIGEKPCFDNIDGALISAMHDKKNDDDKISLIVPATKGNSAELKLDFNEYCRQVVEISQKKVKLALIGKDVSKSISPQIHYFIAKHIGKNISYDLISVAEDGFEKHIDGLIANYEGLNVTIPYKLKVIPHLKKICGDAHTFGAVNTVSCKNLTGDNTDGLGFALMLKNNGVGVNGKNVLIIGAGGAGRSVAKKVLEEGGKVDIYDKNLENAVAVAREFGGITALDEISPKPYYAIINASGVGMHNTVGVSPADESVIKNCQVAVDLIYNPPTSAFLEIAEKLGKKVINGKAMLFYQAYYSECIWHGIIPDEASAKILFEKFEKEII